MKKIRFTQKGYEDLKAQYEQLKKDRPAAVLDLKKARDMGDLSENGYYKAARSKLSSMDYQLRSIAFSLKNSTVAHTPVGDWVDIGSAVTLKNKDGEVTYIIVGDLEANPHDKKISLKSPIGKAVEGKRVGDEVVISTPSGKISYLVVKVEGIKIG